MKIRKVVKSVLRIIFYLLRKQQQDRTKRADTGLQQGQPQVRSRKSGQELSHMQDRSTHGNCRISSSFIGCFKACQPLRLAEDSCDEVAMIALLERKTNVK